jgi:hypothetical protein
VSGILGGLIAALKSGIAWSLRTLPVSWLWKAATYAPLSNASFFAFGASTNTGTTSTYYYSTDGDSWSSGTLPAAVAPRWAVGSGSRVVIGFSFAFLGGGYYTDDGTTWTATSIFSGGGTTIIPQDGFWNGNRFIFVTSNTGSNGLCHSTSGTSWTRYDVGNGGQSIAFDGSSTYVVVLNSSTGRINTTDITSAAAWSNITLPSTSNWTSVRHNGSIWVAAIANSTSYATSTDGTTWTSRTLPAALSGTGTAIRPKMEVRDGKFYYINLDGTTATPYSSTDGINWTAGNTVSSDLTAITCWATSSDKMLAFGSLNDTGASDDYIKGDGK